MTGLPLSLAAGPLTGGYQPAAILGGEGLAGLKANAEGGFDAYAPGVEMAAYGVWVVQLQRVR